MGFRRVSSCCTPSDGKHNINYTKHLIAPFLSIQQSPFEQGTSNNQISAGCCIQERIKINRSSCLSSVGMIQVSTSSDRYLELGQHLSFFLGIHEFQKNTVKVATGLHHCTYNDQSKNLCKTGIFFLPLLNPLWCTLVCVCSSRSVPGIRTCTSYVCHTLCVLNPKYCSFTTSSVVSISSRGTSQWPEYQDPRNTQHTPLPHWQTCGVDIIGVKLCASTHGTNWLMTSISKYRVYGCTVVVLLTVWLAAFYTSNLGKIIRSLGQNLMYLRAGSRNRRDIPPSGKNTVNILNITTQSIST